MSREASKKTMVFGVGMPRTGSASLIEALRILGYKTLHYHPDRLPLYPPVGQSADYWQVFDDVDAVCDFPAALYWGHLMKTYRSRVILTARNVEAWWESMKWHANQIRTGEDLEHARYADALHTLMFGTAQPCEYWWRRRYAEHNRRVIQGVPAGQLLIMDICHGDKWDKLCPFLGVKEPKVDFPWYNKRGGEVEQR